MRRSSVPATLILLAWANACGAQALDAKQAELLKDMDAATAVEGVKLVGKIEGWRRDVDTLRKFVADSGKKPGDLARDERFLKAADGVLKIHPELGQSSENCGNTSRSRRGSRRG